MVDAGGSSHPVQRSLVETFRCEFCDKTLKSASGNRSFVLKEHFVENCVPLPPAVNSRMPLAKVESTWREKAKADRDEKRSSQP